VVGEMTSIGTLFAFILVCIGIIVMRKQMPDAPRAFKTPLVPLVPILGISTCFFMMAFLPLDTWIRLFVWMIIGFDVYLYYGIKNSFLSNRLPASIAKGSKTVALVGIVLAVMLAVIAYFHHLQTEGTDTGIYYFSLIFSLIHLVTFGIAQTKKA
jgi:APA family basic amino acid/polyamine antiporter